MIILYSGTPGSGKSYHVAYKLYYGLRYGRNFICNFPINLSYVKKVKGKFLYVNDIELTPEYLIKYAKENHKEGKESQTMIVIDEAGIMFNPRTWSHGDRLQWIRFLSLHRHYGYDIILATQSDRMIDRQIRGFLQTEIKHRKFKDMGIKGRILSFVGGGTVFVCVKYYYGLKEKIGMEFMRYSKKIGRIYDTMYLSENDVTKASAEPGRNGGEGAPMRLGSAEGLVKDEPT